MPDNIVESKIMGSNDALRAVVLKAIPANRYRVLMQNSAPPEPGDVVEIDQGYTGDDGCPMVLVYCKSKDGVYRYEAEVYESELSSM